MGKGSIKYECFDCHDKILVAATPVELLGALIEDHDEICDGCGQPLGL